MDNINKLAQERRKELAKKLYYTEAITLAEIAERLNINYSTLRGWKYRENWINPFRHRKKRMSQKQLDNLGYFSKKDNRLYWGRLGYHGEFTIEELIDMGKAWENDRGGWTIEALNP